MRKRLRLATVAAIVAVIMAFGPVAMGDTLENFGEPNCFGQRQAHGNTEHGLTPNERAAGLEETIAFFYPISPPEFQEFLEGFFGEDLKVTVGERNKWVKAVCAGEVPFPEE